MAPVPTVFNTSVGWSGTAQWFPRLPPHVASRQAASRSDMPGTSGRLARRTSTQRSSVMLHGGTPLYEYDEDALEREFEVLNLRVYHRRGATGLMDNADLALHKGDVVAGRYQVTEFLGSAAFSKAVQAVDLKTGALVCLKIVKNNKDYFDQSLDEVKLLRYVNAADPLDQYGILRLYDFFYYKEHLLLVCELLRSNLYEFQKYNRESVDEPYFTLQRIQTIAKQVLRSLAFLHSLGVMHCDLKPENVLIKSYSPCEVKVIDLGSSCFVTDHLSSYVQSRSYRAPEVALGFHYGQKIDIWSLGCILAELASGRVLFEHDSVHSMLEAMEGILGPMPSHMLANNWHTNGHNGHNPYTSQQHGSYNGGHTNGSANESSSSFYQPHTSFYGVLRTRHNALGERVPQADRPFLDFLTALLQLDPGRRPSAEEALAHPWLSYNYNAMPHQRKRSPPR